MHRLLTVRMLFDPDNLFVRFRVYRNDPAVAGE